MLFGDVDQQKYDILPLPVRDTWGVLMRRDAPLAEKEAIEPQDLWDKPLIISHQRGDDSFLSRWLQRELAKLNIVATYNLVFNASLLVEEGLGYALCFDKLINTQGSQLCFRPFSPPLYASACIVWKKYQVFLQGRGDVFAMPAGGCCEGLHPPERCSAQAGIGVDAARQVFAAIGNGTNLKPRSAGRGVRTVFVAS